MVNAPTKNPEANYDAATHATYPSVFQPFMDSRLRYAVLVGGAGSGKSFTAAQKLLGRLLTEEGARFLVVRKVGATLKRSVFQLCKDLISQMELSAHFKVSVTDRRIECPETGGMLLFTGIDDPEKIKSIQGISSIWVEEATELTADDFRQLELRLRGDTPGYKQITLTCNPVSDQSWVFTRFCAPELPKNPNLLHIHSTAFDNPFIDKDYLEMLTGSMRDDENYYRIYTEGHWGTEKKTDLFYKHFDLREHLAPAATPNPELPLRLAFDFNVQPYITATVWQIEGRAARQVGELCLEGPRNTVPDLAEALLRKIGPRWPAGVYIHGDPAGRNRNVTGGITPYGQLMAGLAPWQPTLCVPRKAPGVPMRGQWINRILSSRHEDIQIHIGRDCTRTLDDYAHVREDKDGKKVKPKVRDPNGRSYEPYGHCSDANDYLLCSVFADSFEAYQRGGP